MNGEAGTSCGYPTLSDILQHTVAPANFGYPFSTNNVAHPTVIAHPSVSGATSVTRATVATSSYLPASIAPTVGTSRDRITSSVSPISISHAIIAPQQHPAATVISSNPIVYMQPPPPRTAVPSTAHHISVSQAQSHAVTAVSQLNTSSSVTNKVHNELITTQAAPPTLISSAPLHDTLVNASQQNAIAQYHWLIPGATHTTLSRLPVEVATNPTECQRPAAVNPTGRKQRSSLMEDGSVGQHQCPDCGRRYKLARTMRFHQRKDHGLDNAIFPVRCLEELCAVRVRTVNQLRSHLENTHRMQFQTFQNQFSSEEEFKNWKVQTEKVNNVYYAKCRTKLEIDSPFSFTYYYCNRSRGTGKYRPRGAKRKPRQMPTCKVETHCTALFTVRRELTTGKLLVTGCLTHYGHDIELIHLPRIRAKLAKKKKQLGGTNTKEGRSQFNDNEKEEEQNQSDDSFSDKEDLKKRPRFKGRRKGRKSRVFSKTSDDDDDDNDDADHDSDGVYHSDVTDDDFDEDGETLDENGDLEWSPMKKTSSSNASPSTKSIANGGTAKGEKNLLFTVKPKGARKRKTTPTKKRPTDGSSATVTVDDVINESSSSEEEAGKEKESCVAQQPEVIVNVGNMRKLLLDVLEWTKTQKEQSVVDAVEKQLRQTFDDAKQLNVPRSDVVQDNATPSSMMSVIRSNISVHTICSSKPSNKRDQIRATTMGSAAKKCSVSAATIIPSAFPTWSASLRPGLIDSSGGTSGAGTCIPGVTFTSSGHQESLHNNQVAAPWSNQDAGSFWTPMTVVQDSIRSPLETVPVTFHSFVTQQ